MLDILTIASMQGDARITDPGILPKNFRKHYNARPGDCLTVIRRDINGAMISQDANWSLTYRNKAHAHFPLSTTFGRKPMSIWIRNNRCAVPVNCFFSEHKEKVYLIRLINHRLFWCGGVLVEGSFALLSTTAADILAAISETMPLMLKTDQVARWLGADHLRDVVEIADRCGDHWFDFYEVDPEIRKTAIETGKMLRPISMSYREWEERQEQLDRIDFAEDRFNRNNTKGR